MDKAFMLSWDTSLVEDEEHTATLLPFAGAERVGQWVTTSELSVPDLVCFSANPETCRQVDYPDSDVRWPIMSRRMRDILLPHAPRYRLIPCAMLDFEVPPKQRFVDGRPAAGIAIGDFAAVQLLEYTPALDLVRSRYEPDRLLPGEVQNITHAQLVDGPLPSMFRLSAFPFPLFVSSDGRAALEAAGVRGIDFKPISALTTYSV